MRALTFPENAYLAAFLSAFLTSLLTLPAWRCLCLRTGLVDDPGHRKIHTISTPLAGGLAVLTAVLVPLLGALVLLKLGPLDLTSEKLLAHGFSRRWMQLLAIAFGAIAMTGLGVLDDKLELPPLAKFIAQFLIALLIALAGVRINLFVPNLLFSYTITILWILTVINAFNFMDNMNGLCSGLGAIGAGLFAISAMLHGQYLVALISLLTSGALLGFLPHNFPTARAFLGDSGSHLVGYLLAILAILPHFYNKDQPQKLAVLTPLLVLAIPLADLVWVVILRTRMGKPFYIGDTNHLSHRLVRAGLNRPTAVILIWLLAALVGSLAFVSI